MSLKLKIFFISGLIFQTFFHDLHIHHVDRAIHKGGFTGAHVDNVYMSRGTNQLLTCWTPIGDVTMDMGTLSMCEGSHRLPE